MHPTATPAAARYAANLAAIALLRDLATDDRPLTAADRTTLRAYTAFGESALLDRAAASGALTPAEQRAAADGSLTQYFTPDDLAQTLWTALPVPSGPIRVLEIGCGIGAFFAAMPDSWRPFATLIGVEPDPIAGQIAQLLYPEAVIHRAGIEAVGDDQIGPVDLVIGNVPFSEIGVADQSVPDTCSRTLHDYCIARGLRLLRPGGLLFVLTSYGTLDKRDTAVRVHLAQHGDLIAAVRLPQGVFIPTSGSASGADIVALRSRVAPRTVLEALALPWIALAPTVVPYGTTAEGAHFTFGSRLDAREWELITPADDRAEPTARIWANPALTPACTLQVVQKGDYTFLHTAPIPTWHADVAAHLTQALADQHWDSDAASCTPATITARPASPRLGALLGVYDAASALLAAEAAGDDAAATAPLRAALCRTYDDCVAVYGPIAAPENRSALRGRPEAYRLRALETDARTADGRTTVRRSLIFEGPVLTAPPVPAPGSLDATAALRYVRAERGDVDLSRIAELTGLTNDAIRVALTGQIFDDPQRKMLVPADVYLSGDIPAKIAAAEAAGLAANVAALTAVAPAHHDHTRIRPLLGAPWVADDIVTDFVGHLVPVFRTRGGKVTFVSAGATWLVQAPAEVRSATENIATWGTTQYGAVDLVTCALAMRAPTVTVGDPPRIDAEQTTLARAALSRIQAEWDRWVWADPDRTARLVAAYNRQLVRYRRYDANGSHLTFPGLAGRTLRSGDLDPHQKDAVQFALTRQGSLIQLPTGGGKTAAAIAAVAELQRTGHSRRVVIAVERNLLGQWAEAVATLYPALTAAVIRPEGSHRAADLNAAITCGATLLIVTFETLGALLAPEAERRLVEREVATLDVLEAQIARLKGAAYTRGQKWVAKQRAQLKTRLTRALLRTRDNPRAITWDILGADTLVVDEAQAFKSLPLFSTREVSGIPTAESTRAIDLLVKTDDLHARGGRIVFLTATPLTNTVAEVFVFLRYLAPQQLQDMGFTLFDAWLSTFARTVTALEVSPEGSGMRLKERLSRFCNLQPLFDLWYQVVFTRTREQLTIPEPTLVTGKIIPVTVPGGARLRRITAWLADRAARTRANKPHPNHPGDNILAIMNEARKAALDVRLVDGGPPPTVSKLTVVADVVAHLYHQEPDTLATQLIFCDLGVPKPTRPAPARTRHTTTVRDAAPLPDDELTETDAALDNADLDDTTGDTEPRATATERVDLTLDAAPITAIVPAGADALVHTRRIPIYHEIRRELEARGVHPEEIAAIHDAKTPEARTALFARLRRGEVRVLICSKQVTGMNIQDRLLAIHILTPSWRPDETEQIIGRARRQGNRWPSVYIFGYAVSGSLDALIWQRQETKAGFINQVANGNVATDEVEDLSVMEASASEMKAIACGDTRIIRRHELHITVSRLHLLARGHAEQQRHLRREAQDTAYLRDRAQRDQRHAATIAAAFAPTEDHPFRIALVATVGAVTATVFTEREPAGMQVLALLAEAEKSAIRQTVTVGRYRDMDIRLVWDGSTPALTLRWLDDATAEAQGLPITPRPGQTGGVAPRIGTINGDTPRGMIASLEYIVRQALAAPVRCTTEVTRHTTRLAALETSLELPFPEAAELAAASAELAALDAALAAEDAQQQRTPEPTPRDEQPLRWDQLTAHDDAEVLVAPLVRIPTPPDLAAMDAARAVLRAESSTPARSDAMPDILMPTGMVSNAVALEAPAPVLPAPTSQPEPVIVTVAAESTPAQPHHTTRPVFGAALPKLGRGTRRTAPAHYAGQPNLFGEGAPGTSVGAPTTPLSAAGEQLALF